MVSSTSIIISLCIGLAILSLSVPSPRRTLSDNSGLSRESQMNKPSSGPEELLAGRLHIYVVRNPEKWDYTTNELDRYLEDLEGREWVGLFRHTLKCPMGIDQPWVDGEDSSKWRESNRLRFQQAISQYPLLGRMWDTFIDVQYGPKEIEQLRNECLSVAATALDPEAIKGLQKLVASCTAAVKVKSGLYMACD